MVRTASAVAAAVAVAALAAPTEAFLAAPSLQWPAAGAASAVQLRMGFGDAFKKAFANEEFSGPTPNAGLKGGPKYVEVTIDGKKVQAVAGQRLSQVCAAAGVKIMYNCQKGDCGTCEAFGNGKKIRVCQTIVPLNAKSYSVKTKN